MKWVCDSCDTTYKSPRGMKEEEVLHRCKANWGRGKSVPLVPEDQLEDEDN